MIHHSHPPIERIQILLPFVFSPAIDPRDVFTVGDQVVCEYAYAFHARSSFKGGFENLFSEVSLDRAQKTISFTPRFKPKRSDGTSYSPEDSCNAFKKTVQGTKHTSLKTLIADVSCDGDRVVVKLNRLPINLPFLLTLPDFALYDAQDSILKPNMPTTGPYTLQRQDTKEVLMARNEFFPSELRANDVGEVLLKSYPASQTSELIKNLHPDKDHFLYLYGYAVSDADLLYLKEPHYDLSIQPSEWLVYVGLQPQVSLADRSTLADFLDAIRPSLTASARNGVAAYSVSPSDGPFGLTESEYQSALTTPHDRNSNTKLSRSMRIATLDEWSTLPLFAKVLGELQHRFPNISIATVSRKDMSQIYSAKHYDAYITPMGLNPGDPMTHLMFLKNTNEFISTLLSMDELVAAGGLEDFDKFSSTVKHFESRLASQRAVVPLFHFPGMIATSNHFLKTAKLGSGWGIQAWQYQVR